MDLDRNGEISLDEAIQHAKRRHEHADKDGDGVVTRKEILEAAGAWFARGRAGHGPRFGAGGPVGGWSRHWAGRTRGYRDASRAPWTPGRYFGRGPWLGGPSRSARGGAEAWRGRDQRARPRGPWGDPPGSRRPDDRQSGDGERPRRGR